MYKKKIHSYLSSLSKIPQVRLIKDSEQNSKLIDNCSAFISITGSAGWEAIIKKPVINFETHSIKYFLIFLSLSVGKNLMH